MDGKSLEILSDKITKLKEIIPEAFTEEKIDWEKLKAALGEDINFENERYNLNWAGKSDAFRVLQQRTSGTLRPVKDESVNFDKTENVFIEGENLEVLKILQKSYFGKIKMIYIDPPYNTGSDSFIYPDKFSETKDEYLKRIGDKDEEGFLLKEGFFRKNSKESGHYHSNWLSMMYPRLYTARNLLREDGVIFVSIDDNEVHNLRMIMNEIFGEENFVATFIWKRRSSSALAEKNTSIDHEYIVCYQKMNLNFFLGNKKDYSGYSNPDDDPRGQWVTGDLTVGMTKDQRPNQFYVLVDPKTGRAYNPNPNRVWAFIPESMNKLLEENRVIFPDDINKRPMLKRFKDELKSTTNPFSTWLAEVGMNSEATREIREILEANIFSYSKPLSLVKEIIRQTLRTNEIVLDFFAGSGTTAQAVMELNKEDGGNRKFILVQLPEKTDENSEAYKAKYFTIADICKERIRRVIEKINRKGAETQGEIFAPSRLSGEVPGFKVFKLVPSNFKMWRSDLIETEEDLNKMVDLFDTQIKPDAKIENMLYELMLKSGFTLTDKIEKVNGYYSVNEGQAVFVLDKIDQTTINEVIKLKPQSCIILDDLFAGNDQLKTNTALQMKDAGVELVTV
ncbi:MAG: site-specific DNA-methyltransferase [Ignavibacteriaceae bacterium]